MSGDAEASSGISGHEVFAVEIILPFFARMNSNFRDICNLASKLSVRRTANFVRVLFGYYVSRIFGKPFVFGMPISVSVEPTTSCNLRCPECPSGLRSFTRKTGMLEERFFRQLTDQLYRDVMYMIFYFQGEPFLNPDILKMISYASSKSIYTSTSTNAHYLNDVKSIETIKSGLDRLIISIDGTTQEVYEQYRIGGNLQKVLDGARNIVRWKQELKSSTPYLVFQFLVVRPNEHQVEDAQRLAKEIGVDKIVFKTAQVYDYENGNPLIPVNSRYSRYRKNSTGKYEIRNKLLNHCWRLWYSSVITWDGKTVPCCFDKDANYMMGDLRVDDFKKIWKSFEYNRFRSSVLRSRKETDICQNCSEGTTVFT